MKIIIVIIVLLYFIISIKSDPSITFKELLYNNGTLSFSGYPISTQSDQCQFTIPFQIDSTEEIISVDSLIGTVKYTDSSTNKLRYIGTLSVIVTGLPQLVQFQVHHALITSATSINLYCLPFDIPSIQFSIVNLGIYYNNLALLIQSSGLPYENVTLDIGTVIPVKQHYIGSGLYFISLQYNTEVLFSSDADKLVTLPINFVGVSKQLSFISPFPYSTIITSTFRAYPINNLQQSKYSALLQLDHYSSLDNYFYGINSNSLFIDEPYLISSENNYYSYLVPLYAGISSTYLLYYYHNNINELSFVRTFNQTSILFDLPYISPPYDTGSVIEVGLVISDSTYPNTIQLGQYSNPLIFRYPFGCSGGNSNNLMYSFPVVVLSNRKSKSIIPAIANNNPFDIVVTQTDTIQPSDNPSVYDFSFELIPNNKMALYFKITHDNVDSIAIYESPSTIYKTYQFYEVLVRSHGPVGIAVQILLPRFNLYQFQIITKDQYFIDFVLDEYYLYNVDDDLSSLTSIQDLDKLSNYNYLTGLKNVSFLFNDLVVTNRGVSNKMYITLENYPISREVKATFIYSDYRANEKKDIVYSTFNLTTNQFEFEFNIPKNIKTGNVSYTITLDSLGYISYYSYSLPSEYQLRISESNNIDLLGPVITSLKSSLSYNPNTVTYYLGISDTANGFKFGYILVRGSIDTTERNITITPSNLYAGTLLKGAYSVEFNYDSPCNVQVYTIVYAYFEDTEGYSTEYDVLKPNKKNPFYLIIDTLEPSIIANCASLPTANGDLYNPDIVDLKTPPVSTFFKSNEASRTLSFNYTASHQDGISSTYLPTLYLSNKNIQVIKSFSTVILSSNSTHTEFSSKIVLPFTDAGYYYISIYGIVSKAGTNGGFTPSSLKNKNLPNSVIYSTSISLPVITGSSKLSSTGLGGLWLYGLYLNLESLQFQIQYTEFNQTETLTPANVLTTAVFFNTTRPTTKPIKIIITGTGSDVTDPYTIYPVVYDYNPVDSSSSGNGNSNCKGTPLCGGPSQGTCISTGCKCILPWTGDDCMSRIIQIDPPTVNETNPSTNITTGEHATINSIVSIIGIKELSINSNEVNRYYFEEWAYNLVLNDSYITRYTYSSFIKKDDIKVSNITVTLDWYKVESTIQFANEELHINPSSIKYTIKISNYPFSSQLNTLQLIMKASLQTSNSESCSDKQIIESNDADYFKLQVDEFSFYCRFIKRCQLDDNKVTKLTNTILDSKMNDTIINDSNQISQSYIGINIPFFNDNVVIDPDFSIILDSNAAKSNCKGDSGLTTPQLAGIIVGSICFFIVLVIISGAIIYKSPGCMSVKIRVYKLFRGSK